MEKTLRLMCVLLLASASLLASCIDDTSAPDAGNADSGVDQDAGN